MMSETQDLHHFFTDNNYYTGPPLMPEMIRRAAENLGVKIPNSYIELLSYRNGGTPQRKCFPTPFSTSWAEDHFKISGIRGVGGEWGIDSRTGLANDVLIEEWDYPRIGVVICDTPSAGHDTVMLDYSKCGASGEPEVVYVDEDRVPRKVADNFAVFISRLIACECFESRT